MLYNPHWLPVKFKFDLKILLLTEKTITGSAPFYLQERNNLKEAYNLLSDCDGLLLKRVVKGYRLIRLHSYVLSVFLVSGQVLQVCIWREDIVKGR